MVWDCRSSVTLEGDLCWNKQLASPSNDRQIRVWPRRVLESHWPKYHPESCMFARLIYSRMHKCQQSSWKGKGRIIFLLFRAWYPRQDPAVRVYSGSQGLCFRLHLRICLASLGPISAIKSRNLYCSINRKRCAVETTILSSLGQTCIIYSRVFLCDTLIRRVVDSAVQNILCRSSKNKDAVERRSRTAVTRMGE
jgi:hypothetical protein